MSTEDNLEGFLTLEGPLLEMAYAALCVSRKERVIPRYESLGVFHDLLLRKEKGYVVVECLGEPKVSSRKLAGFKNEVLELNEKLRGAGDKPVIEARIVSMTKHEDWTAETERKLRELEEELRGNSIELTFIGPKKLVYDLISNSIIGMGVLNNSIIFVGLDEQGIRYDPSDSIFKLSGSTVDFEEFRKLPHSFMPRDYWSEDNKKVFEEYAEITGSPMPEWFSWSYPDHIGIRWRSARQIKKAIMQSFSSGDRTIVFESNSAFLTKRNLGKNSYYTVNLVYHKPVIDSKDAVNMEKAVSLLIEEARREGRLEDGLDFYSRIFTDTVTFTYSYWSKARYSSFHGKISYTEVNRGEEVLMEALNSGSLGFKLSAGRIKFSMEEGPDTLKIVQGGLHWESELRESYPAIVRF